MNKFETLYIIMMGRYEHHHPVQSTRDARHPREHIGSQT